MPYSMKRLSPTDLTDPIHRILNQKDERELYSQNSLDYYALHYRRRISTIVRTIVNRGSKRILETGSAQGNSALTCAEQGVEACALDINVKHLTYSRLKYEQGPQTWVTASADALPFRNGYFDAVVLGEILEHCAWPEQILENAARVLSNEGVIIITTPNNRYIHSSEQPFSQVASNRSSIEQHQFGPDGDNHLFTFTMSELSAVVRSAGLHVKKTEYIGSHFLHCRATYYLRRLFPALFSSVLEQIVPALPFLGERYCSTLFMVAGKSKHS